jgi:hypothetical protein
MAKDTDARGLGGFSPQKDTDARGGGERALPPRAEDIFARASQLGGLLVVAFIAPVGGGGSTQAPQPKTSSFASLGQLADRRDRADGVQTRELIQDQAQKIGVLAGKVNALTAQVATRVDGGGGREQAEKRVPDVGARGNRPASPTSELAAARPQAAPKK